MQAFEHACTILKHGGTLDWDRSVEAPVIRLRFDNVARSSTMIYDIVEQRRSMSCNTLTGSEINDRKLTWSAD